MSAFLEIILAALAAFGLGSLLWLALGRLVAPAGRGGGVVALIPARGDGDQLEYELAGLRWLRGTGLAEFRVVIADAGLDATGRALAGTLAAGDPAITLCPLEGLPACLEEEWKVGKRDGACGGSTQSD